MTRDLTGKNETSPLPVSASAISTTVAAPELNGSASSTSLAISRPVLTSGGVQSFLDKATDEGLVILQSPRVRMQNNFFSCTFYKVSYRKL